MLKNELFWTEKKLIYMMEKILPKCETVAEAIDRARKRWKRNFDRSTFNHRFKEKFKHTPGQYLKKQEYKSETAKKLPPKNNPVFLKQRIKSLERELSRATEQSVLADIVKHEIHGMANLKPDQPPSWLMQKNNKMYHGVPTLLFSDLHYGEVIHSAQVNNSNKYNMEIANKRIERVFTKTAYLLDSILTKADYPGIVLTCAGDILSGNIHEEIRENNQSPIFVAMMECASQIEAGIKLLKKRFKCVFVPWMVGNHGRFDRKPRSKYGPQDNFEYILGHWIKKTFEKDPDVVVAVSDSFMYHYEIYNTRYLVMHGDMFRGGVGIQGPILPWMLGDHKLRKQMQGIEKLTGVKAEYDVLLFGHWHILWPTPGFISNGSIKGFDEYAMSKGYPCEEPKQALWLTHPTHGVTINAPIKADSDQRFKKKKPWISYPYSERQV